MRAYPHRRRTETIHCHYFPLLSYLDRDILQIEIYCVLYVAIEQYLSGHYYLLTSNNLKDDEEAKA